ncbi:MAG: SAM-dependent methyltransferase [Cyclobacteriaceae bacterium]|nr:SAM-dependent methyltransferase [Cyclobacteriaceae bacterium]
MSGILYLIPTVISEGNQQVIPPQVTGCLAEIHHFLAEDIRTARRYLSSLKIYPSIEALHFEVLNKETTEKELAAKLNPLLQGLKVGVLSESGCPGVADPGALAVAFAHAHNLKVVPLVGPSAILLALMASGLNGQQFAFNGYLPIDAPAAAKKIKELERESFQKNQTQIFIETPYRNNAIFTHLVTNLNANTRLTIALDLTGPQEVIATKTVAEWKTHIPVWPKAPAVFLFLS